MAVHPLRPATRRRLGRPLPHQQADRPRAHPTPKKLSNHHTKNGSYPVLDPVSQAYPEVQGRSPTCYSPVRHSSTSASTGLSVRLACVKHAASVHPEPGSNSPQKTFQKETGREKPNTQPKTNQPTPKQAPDWQKSKNYKVQQPTPTRRGKTGVGQKYVKHVQPHPTHTMNQKMTRLVIGIQPRHHRHTPKHRAHTTQCTKQGQANTPTQQKYIGTLSSSQTTPAHPTPTHTQ